MKIRDQYIGTKRHCPKCKAEFVVSAPQEDLADESVAVSEQAPPSTATAPQKAPPPSKKQAKPASDDDFDPMAVLMSDDGPGMKATAGLRTPDPVQKTPQADSRGRRRILPTSPEEEEPGDMPAAASAAAAMTASANARDLLSKAQDDSRVRASLPPTEERQPTIDFSMARAQVMEYWPWLVGVPAGILLLYFGMSQMLSETRTLPDLGRVTGTLTLDGKPFPAVQVYLTPVQRDAEVNGKTLRLRDAVGVTDENGYFDVQYVDGIYGAPVGKVYIWLQPIEAKDFKKIPPKYVTRSPSNEVREVREAGNAGEFDITLNSK